MNLSDEDKRRIYEEEKAKIEAEAASSVTDTSSKQPTKKGLSGLTYFALTAMFFGLVIAIFPKFLPSVLPSLADRITNGPDASTQSQASEGAIKVSASNLINAYKANEVAADGQYRDKLVEVTGIVGDVKKDITDTIYVTLGTGAAFELPTVQCFFSNDYADKASKLRKGFKMTIRGRVEMLMGNVLVKDCEF